MKNRTLIFFAFATGLMTMPSMARAETSLQKIAASILASKFGTTTRTVTAFQSQTNLPVYELAPIYQGAHYFHTSPSIVWQLRRQGLGWGEIAHRLGMNPGTFNKLRKQGVFDRNRFWETSYQERFGVPNEQLLTLRRNGASEEDELGCVVVGRLTRRSPAQVYQQFRTQRSWSSVTTNHNVRFEDWQRVSMPVRTRFYVPTTVVNNIKTKSNNGVRNHGKGVGIGAAYKRSEPVSGNGKVAGKGSGERVVRAGAAGHNKSNAKTKDDHGHGNGKDHGKGKGKGKGGGSGGAHNSQSCP